MKQVSQWTLLSIVLASFDVVRATLEEEPDILEEYFGNIADEDEALSFMQSHSAMKSGPHKVLSDAAAGVSSVASGPSHGAAGLSDSIVFSQTELKVILPEAPGTEINAAEANSLETEPLFLKQQVQDDEDMTCSLEGLTPGVCAMAALARPPPAATATADGGAAAAPDLDFLRPERLERALFAELEAAMAGTHGGFTAAHVRDLEEELSGFFAALPKNENGRLAHATVRYAVHQQFLRQHAWYIRSLNPVGEAQTPASPGEALRGQVPEHLQSLIEKQQEGRGLGLRELAAMVATLEHLIQGDMGERLKAAYAAHGLRANGTVSGHEVTTILETFMAHFLSLEHRSGYALTPEQARNERIAIEGYSGWPAVKNLVHGAVQKRSSVGVRAPFPFADALAAAKEVMDGFETMSAEECRGIKKDLSAMQEGTAGRVLLADLHRKALEGAMLFAESTEYLATLGALDESEPGRPRVLVPNYVYSPSNCLGTTSFFDMCCPNECEALLQRLERGLRSPEVTPAEVVELLATTPGEGMDAASVSGPALAELDALAHAREGRVPLHGLAFARWLHRAFPHECPRPRVEDFAGARGTAEDAEVPDAERKFQPVAALETMTASKAELMAELLQQEQEAAVAPTAQASNHSSQGTAAASADGDMPAEKLKGLAAKTLSGASGLKLASLDATSLAQVQVKVEPEDGTAPAAKSGLNIKALQ